MTIGETYICKDCGLEMQVIHECKDKGKSEDESGCPPCNLSCCGHPLELKA
jgi:hypothetical protein